MEGKENLFYLNPEQAGNRGGDEWKIYGGHRLWCAPEVKEFTYFPDNLPVTVSEIDSGIQFTAPMEKSGVVKTLVLSPLERRNGFQASSQHQKSWGSGLFLAPLGADRNAFRWGCSDPHNLKPPQTAPAHAHFQSLGLHRSGRPPLALGKTLSPAPTRPEQRITTKNRSTKPVWLGWIFGRSAVFSQTLRLGCFTNLSGF